jgi:3D (Asp-Asp-Asp) domain-containing protein
MAGPAAAIAAKAAARAAGAEALKRLQPRLQPPPPPKDGRGTLKALIAIAVIVVLLPALIVAVLLGGAQQNADCAPAGALPGTWTGPGSLGGVAGTGVTPAELAAARAIRGVGGTRLTAGTYSPTAYFPNPHAPATNCSSTCTTTASGIRVNNATRRAYLIASNPQLNQYGALAYIWPNPYAWTGPFVVADTGSAFGGTGRLDFYIFIAEGESWQQALGRAYQWGPANQVKVSAAPIRSGGPTIATSPLGPGPADLAPGATPPTLNGPSGACGAPVAPGSLGELTGTPEQIVNRVVLYAHDHGFPGITPASVRAANDAHSILTTSGNRSDHKGPPDVAWAADIGNGPAPTHEEDVLARTVAAAFGITWPGAGLATGGNSQYRIQIIYRTCDGGDHFTHLHVGIRRGPGPRPSTLLPARPCGGGA